MPLTLLCSAMERSSLVRGGAVFLSHPTRCSSAWPLYLSAPALTAFSRQAVLAKTGGLGDHVAMALLLLGNTSVALLLALQQQGGAFGRLPEQNLLGGRDIYDSRLALPP